MCQCFQFKQFDWCHWNSGGAMFFCISRVSPDPFLKVVGLAATRLCVYFITTMYWAETTEPSTIQHRNQDGSCVGIPCSRLGICVELGSGSGIYHFCHQKSALSKFCHCCCLTAKYQLKPRDPIGTANYLELKGCDPSICQIKSRGD